MGHPPAPVDDTVQLDVERDVRASSSGSLHFLLMFVLRRVCVHHVYSAVLFDVEEHNGELSSIVTGYKANLLDVEDGRRR